MGNTFYLDVWSEAIEISLNAVMLSTFPQHNLFVEQLLEMSITVRSSVVGFVVTQWREEAVCSSISA
jgi:hypothetical protein